MPHDSPTPGTVYLVGAGPGDPDLLTLRAARLIAQADDLVVDALVPVELYRGTRARVVYVGKRGGRPHIHQRQIEEILVTLARSGRKVVRLKGGDPSVFGRAAEEMDALREAGIAVEVVPGISSALAAPLLAGVCVTERGVADRLTIVTGHHRDEVDGLPALPAFYPDQTVVVLMGLSRLEQLVEQFLRTGYPPQLPAAVVSRASLRDQHQVASSLEHLVHVVDTADPPIKAPAVLIVGRVARRAGVGAQKVVDHIASNAHLLHANNSQ